MSSEPPARFQRGAAHALDPIGALLVDQRQVAAAFEFQRGDRHWPLPCRKEPFELYSRFLSHGREGTGYCRVLSPRKRRPSHASSSGSGRVVATRTCARPEQSPGPSAGRGSNGGGMHEAGVLRDARPFGSGARQMRKDNGGAKKAGGQDIRAHVAGPAITALVRSVALVRSRAGGGDAVALRRSSPAGLSITTAASPGL